MGLDIRAIRKARLSDEGEGGERVYAVAGCANRMDGRAEGRYIPRIDAAVAGWSGSWRAGGSC
jgi:hypothetical protein